MATREASSPTGTSLSLWRKPNEDQERALNSVYRTHPIDGTKMLDVRQMNYRYEVFDYEKAALRKYRLDPKERNLNTDFEADDAPVMISKDTAYINDNGDIVRETINRPLRLCMILEHLHRSRVSRHHRLGERLPQC